MSRRVGGEAASASRPKAPPLPATWSRVVALAWAGSSGFAGYHLVCRWPKDGPQGCVARLAAGSLLAASLLVVFSVVVALRRPRMKT